MLHVIKVFFSIAVVAEDGFKDQKHRVSCREYYAYRIQIRVTNYLLRVNRLFQQFVCEDRKYPFRLWAAQPILASSSYIKGLWTR
jgi:hypothetical protein